MSGGSGFLSKYSPPLCCIYARALKPGRCEKKQRWIDETLFSVNLDSIANTPSPSTKQRQFQVAVDWEPSPPQTASSSPFDIQDPSTGIFTGILAGAVVFVDTGDASPSSTSYSGRLEEKLQKMGAKVVTQWRWNSTIGGKVGITHVVFKNGSMETLTKVQESNGVVVCVTEEWVLK